MLSKSFGLALLLSVAAPATLLAQTNASAQASYPRLRIGGFTDLEFFVADTEDGPNTSGFAEGQFVLHFTSELAPRLGFFGEVTFTPRDDGFGVEVERTIVRFDYRDYMKVSGGRYHTPINWWNNAFHHGLWLQTSVDRPEMTKFGGRFVPVHFVGGLVEGAVPSRGLGLNYRAGIGNGRGTITSRAGDRQDNNNNRAWLVNLFMRPDRLYWLDLGGAVYRDKVSLEAATLDEWIASGHIVWTKETPELIVEYAHSRHDDVATDVNYVGDAVYAQVAYRLPWMQERWKPYFRWEHMDVQPEDPVFEGRVDDFAQYLVGVRVDVSELVALKGEYRYTERGEGVAKKDENSFFAQVSLAF